MAAVIHHSEAALTALLRASRLSGDSGPNVLLLPLNVINPQTIWMRTTWLFSQKYPQGISGWKLSLLSVFNYKRVRLNTVSMWNCSSVLVLQAWGVLPYLAHSSTIIGKAFHQTKKKKKTQKNICIMHSAPSIAVPTCQTEGRRHKTFMPSFDLMSLLARGTMTTTTHTPHISGTASYEYCTTDWQRLYLFIWGFSSRTRKPAGVERRAQVGAGWEDGAEQQVDEEQRLLSVKRFL